MTTQALKRDDMVVLSLNGRCYKDCRVLATYPEFHNAVRVEQNGNEVLTTPDHLELFSDYEERRARERVEQEREKYGSLIDAWHKGYQEPGVIAKFLGLPDTRGLAGKIKACKRRNFIK